MTVCSCGGRGFCQDCVIKDFGRETAQVLWLHRSVEAALARPSNVVPLHGYSIKVVS